MEIRQVGDLIPYRSSLKDLWDKEEFQPVLKLLSSMKEESVLGVRALNLTEDAETVKTKVAVLKTQLNFANMMLELPAVIKETEEQIERNKVQKHRIANAQEKGDI